MISPTLISDLRNTSKPKEKQLILKNNDCDFLRYLLKATYEPFETFHIKVKKAEIPEPGFSDITEPYIREMIVNVVEFCRQSHSNKQNREKVLIALSNMTRDTQELLLGVLHKNWKAGISSKTITKVFPGLITQFNVQLANTYAKVCKKKSYKPKDRYCSFKLDGIRSVALRNGGQWKLFSRQGKEFLTVDHLKPELELLWETHGTDFWDGELYIPGASFETIQSYVTSFTKGTAKEIEYHTFICGKEEAFLKNIYHKSYFKIVEDHHITPQIKSIKPAAQWLISENQIPEELERAFELGYEGIMLRDPDKLYSFNRSDALLKLKESASNKSQEQVTDCLVINYDLDAFPVIINETLVYKTLLVRLYVEQKNGLVCKIGSGFSLDFREKYTKFPEELLGKVIEVKFQGYGSNKLMRFPRFRRLREDIEW